MSALVQNIKQQSSSFQTKGAAIREAQYSVALVFKGSSFNVDVALETRIGDSAWIEITDTERTGITTDGETKQYNINIGKHWEVRANVTVNSGTVDLDFYVSR